MHMRGRLTTHGPGIQRPDPVQEFRVVGESLDTDGPSTEW